MKEALLEIIKFDVKDIITASTEEDENNGFTDGGNNDNPGGDISGDIEWNSLDDYDTPYGQ